MRATEAQVADLTLIAHILQAALAAHRALGGVIVGYLACHDDRPFGPVVHRGGVLALGAYGFVVTFQPDPNFGRILAAYGGVFVAGSLAWGMLLDGFRPDRYDITGAAVCLIGVAVIMYGPRG